MGRKRNGVRVQEEPRTHSMNSLLRLQPTPILIHILIRPFHKRKGGSIMIHIPPYSGLGEDECFLNVSGLRAGGAIGSSDENDLDI